MSPLFRRRLLSTKAASSSCTIHRAALYAEQPWANGLGVTREIAADRRGTPSDAPFRWRLSIAALSPPGGPFSVIPGVDRVLTLLSGQASLAVGAGQALEPLGIGVPFGPFPADVETDSSVPVEGSDLNVMWDRSSTNAAVSIVDGGTASSSVSLNAETDTLFMVALAYLDAEGETCVRTSDGTVQLGYLDSLQVEPEAPDTVLPPLEVVAGRVLVVQLSVQ